MYIWWWKLNYCVYICTCENLPWGCSFFSSLSSSAFFSWLHSSLLHSVFHSYHHWSYMCSDFTFFILLFVTLLVHDFIFLFFILISLTWSLRFFITLSISYLVAVVCMYIMIRFIPHGNDTEACMYMYIGNTYTDRYVSVILYESLIIEVVLRYSTYKLFHSPPPTPQVCG